MTGTRRSPRHLPGLAALGLLFCTWAAPPPLLAQSDDTGPAQLRERLAERFNLAPMRDGEGVLLVPRRDREDVRFIEVVGGTISINGEIVSGRELERRIGNDARPVLQLSYLDREGRAAVLNAAQDGAIEADTRDTDRDRADSRFVRRSQDIVRVIGSAAVERDEMVIGDVVVIAGNSRVDGIVTGDVVVIAGNLRLGPEAEVRGDVVAVVSVVDRARGAVVDGEFVNVGAGNPFAGWDVRNPFRGRFPLFPRVMGVFGTLVRLSLVVMLGWLAVALARRPLQRIADRAAAEPFKAGLVGILVELLFFPLLVLISVLLAVSIVGIPLLVLIPVLVLLFVVVLIAGFAAVAMRVGQWLGARLGNSHLEAYAAVAVGTIVLLSLALFARFAFFAGGFITSVGVALGILAFCVEYVAWTVGLGAAVLVRLAPRPLPPGTPVMPIAEADAR